MRIKKDDQAILELTSASRNFFMWYEEWPTVIVSIKIFLSELIWHAQCFELRYLCDLFKTLTKQ